MEGKGTVGAGPEPGVGRGRGRDSVVVLNTYLSITEAVLSWCPEVRPVFWLVC